MPPIAAGQQKAGMAGANAAVMRLLEQVLQQLLAAKATDASCTLALARAIETFAPLVALRPQLASAIINKVGHYLMFATYLQLSRLLGAAAHKKRPLA